MESEAFLLGMWRSYYELEESLSLPELQEILRARREQKEMDMKFLAGVNGIDLDGGATEEPETDEDRKFKFDIVKARAEAKIKGESPEAAEMHMFGIRLVEE